MVGASGDELLLHGKSANYGQTHDLFVSQIVLTCCFKSPEWDGKRLNSLTAGVGRSQAFGG
jgi:hypothetical protein